MYAENIIDGGFSDQNEVLDKNRYFLFLVGWIKLRLKEPRRKSNPYLNAHAG